MRCSELLGLKWGDINYKNKTIHISRATTAVNRKPVTAPPKSKSSIRTLPVSSELIEMLKSQKGPKDDFIVLTANKKVLDDSQFTRTRYKTFFIDLQAAHPEIEKLSPHELRHTCGTLLYAKTKDIYAVSKYLGHANIGITTKYYMHEDVEVLRTNLGVE